MSTEEVLLARYDGAPLLSVEQLAQVLHRSPGGLRNTLCGDNDLAHKLKCGRVKIGRRVYFRTCAVAQLIDQA